jgi:hypothetical protein
MAAMSEAAMSEAAMSEAAMSEILVIALVYERTAYAGLGLMLARHLQGLLENTNETADLETESPALSLGRRGRGTGATHP